MIKAIIIEDEDNNVESLCYLLDKYCEQVSIISIATSVKDAAIKIRELKPDLIFLDIHLTDGTGFQLLELFQKPDFDVIFTTAYDQYAIKAFKFNGIDYLLKPIDAKELVSAVEKCKTATRRTEFKNVPQQSLNKLPLPTLQGYILIDLKDIIRCEASDNYTAVYLSNEKYVISRSLSVLDTYLQDKGFIRVHRSHLVNLSHIQSMEKGKTAILKMSDGENIPVSGNYRSGLDDLLHIL